MFPRLEELKLEELRADKIWEGQLAPESFQNLTRLEMRSCHKLSYLFSSLMVENLGQLKVLSVRDCDSVEEIVVAIGGEEMTEEKLLLFPKLEVVVLWGLKKLKRFCHANLLECPSLKTLSVSDCKELLTFITNDDANNIGDLETIKSSVLFDEKVAFPNLEELILSKMDQLEMIWGNELHPDSFSNLKRLHIDDCHKIDMQLNGTFAKIIPILDYYHFERDGFRVRCRKSDGELYIQYPELFGGGSHVFPVALLQGFQHLKKLVVKGSNLEQVLFRSDLQLINPGDDEDTVAKILARIQSLELDGLREMTYIWSEHFPLDQILNLKSLRVWECDSLISLAPSTALFQNLRHLKLYRCQKLMKLFTSSTARSLINLIEMTVKHCDSLTEIVGDIIDEDAIEDNNDIVFDNLKELKLVALTSLTSFCSAHNCSFKFPSLNSVTVEQCPNMVFFSPGILTAPKLTRVMEEENEEELWRWEGDLNSTIRQWHREQMTNQDTKELHSTNMEEDCLQQQQ